MIIISWVILNSALRSKLSKDIMINKMLVDELRQISLQYATMYKWLCFCKTNLLLDFLFYPKVFYEVTLHC